MRIPRCYFHHIDRSLHTFGLIPAVESRSAYIILLCSKLHPGLPHQAAGRFFCTHSHDRPIPSFHCRAFFQSLQRSLSNFRLFQQPDGREQWLKFRCILPPGPTYVLSRVRRQSVWQSLHTWSFHPKEFASKYSIQKVEMGSLSYRWAA